MMRSQRAFTLLELMIVIVVIAVVMMIAAPSFVDFIRVQRLKSINAQLITDLQLTRAEAVSRGTLGRIVFNSNSTLTCYSIFVLKPGSSTAIRCDCRLGAGSACTSSDAIEVKTVLAPLPDGVTILPSGGSSAAMAFDNVTGGLMSIPTDKFPKPLAKFQIDVALDETRTLRTVLSPAGRPTVCALGPNLGASLC